MKGAILVRRGMAPLDSGACASLLPADAAAEAALSKIPLGETVMVKLDLSRSNPQNKLYWGIISHVAVAAGYESDRALHQALKVALGYFDVVRLPNGKALACPQSTAFDAMSADEFQTYMDGAIRLICSEIVPGTNGDDLIRDVQAMLGEPALDPGNSAPESPQAPRGPIIAPGGAAAEQEVMQDNRTEHGSIRQAEHKTAPPVKTGGPAPPLADTTFNVQIMTAGKGGADATLAALLARAREITLSDDFDRLRKESAATVDYLRNANRKLWNQWLFQSGEMERELRERGPDPSGAPLAMKLAMKLNED
jgi:hypothetical protein